LVEKQLSDHHTIFMVPDDNATNSDQNEEKPEAPKEDPDHIFDNFLVLFSRGNGSRKKPYEPLEGASLEDVVRVVSHLSMGFAQKVHFIFNTVRVYIDQHGNVGLSEEGVASANPNNESILELVSEEAKKLLDIGFFYQHKIS